LGRWARPVAGRISQFVEEIPMAAAHEKAKKLALELFGEVDKTAKTAAIWTKDMQDAVDFAKKTVEKAKDDDLEAAISKGLVGVEAAKMYYLREGKQFDKLVNDIKKAAASVKK
jgi:hypothetical protein